ncbi:hypothetical protein L1889_18235 [Paenalcaligenes niemegkensis]|uniref:hypothetical protein n=1 Tax=Paenalcaligenes niemegkensis TaxID=2895469 RepID=UPI001EE7D32A|nr:hypothetical protein [Paenalcaligenes niemegkensis]MCQ9618379.1 hypothetical protein [Paenalcaligenes niemegkensis]
MLFVLSVNHKGRIVLDTVRHGRTLYYIDAEPQVEDDELIRSAWLVARDEVPCYVFHHKCGYGYQLSEGLDG